MLVVLEETDLEDVEIVFNRDRFSTLDSKGKSKNIIDKNEQITLNEVLNRLDNELEFNLATVLELERKQFDIKESIEDLFEEFEVESDNDMIEDFIIKENETIELLREKVKIEKNNEKKKLLMRDMLWCKNRIKQLDKLKEKIEYLRGLK